MPADAPDVVVVGGGIVGTSAAAFLAGEGARVTLIEAREIAAGASGRNSGVVQHPFRRRPCAICTWRLSRPIARWRPRTPSNSSCRRDPLGCSSSG